MRVKHTMPNKNYMLEKSSKFISLIKTYRTLVHLNNRGLLVGFKSQAFLDVGFIYAAYAPSLKFSIPTSSSKLSDT